VDDRWWDFADASDGEAEPQLNGHGAEWEPRKLLQAVFGDTGDAAYYACEAWAFDDESLKTAVSAACEWGLRHDVDGKPGAYVRKSLGRYLPEVTRQESLDTWENRRKGQRCPMCDGKGFDDAGPCEYCGGTGTLQKRRRVRVNKQAPLRHVESDDGEDIDTPELTDPGRARYDPDYQRSFIAGTRPETVVDDAPPPAVLQAVQWMTAGLLHRYMGQRVEPAARLGAKYVWVDGMSYRDAAERITADGYPVSYGELRRKLMRLRATMDAIAPPGPGKVRLRSSRAGFGGHIPIWQRNWFLDGLLL
jgi:hypothetical protein